MRNYPRRLGIALVLLGFSGCLCTHAPAAASTNMPAEPTIVVQPQIAPSTGAGSVFASDAGLWPGLGKDYFRYETNEYLLAGIAAGAPYTTRLVIRQSADASRFSGLVVAEAMHPAGQAHAFQHNSVYVMDAGHITVEIATLGFEQIRDFNPQRYGALNVAAKQVSAILTQAGARAVSY